MEVINIIVNDITSTVSVDSFGVLDDENRQASIDAAEEFFIEKCKELKFGKGFANTKEVDDYHDMVNELIDDGYVEIGELTVTLFWSSIDNIQM